MRVLDDWLLTAARAAIHLPTRTAVVADLHLGYDRVRQRGGEALPVRSIAAELNPLRDLLSAHNLHALVVAGDLFEDGRCQSEALAEEFLAWVAEAGVELAGVVPGNHDRGLARTRLPLCREGIVLGGWHVVHGHGEPPDGPIVQGHEHPLLRWRAGTEGPCYLARPGHLVLPAYSADVAGVNVLGRPRWLGHRCYVIAGEEVLDFGEVGALTTRLRRPRG